MTSEKFLGEVQWLGEAVGVGTIQSFNVILAAFKDDKFLKQWNIVVTVTKPDLIFVKKFRSGVEVQPYLIKNWSTAVALGANRLCAVDPGDPSTSFLCYDGKNFWYMASKSVPTTTKPTVTCGPGPGGVYQIPYQHSDGSWGCKPVNEFEGSGDKPGTPRIPGIPNCPPGQHWSTHLKKCIPTPAKKQVQRPVVPYFRGGQTQGVETDEYPMLPRVDNQVGVGEMSQPFLGELRWPPSGHAPPAPRPATPGQAQCPPGYVYDSRYHDCRKIGGHGLHGIDPFSWIGSPSGQVGDQAACDAFNAKLQAAKSKRDSIKSYMVDLDAARIEAYTNEGLDSATGKALDAQYAGQKGALDAANAEVNDLNKKIETCMGLKPPEPGGPPPPKGVPCNVSNDCAPEQICVNGVCVDCPVGQARDASGNCAVPAAGGGGKKSSGIGLLLLGLGATGAFFVAIKPPTLPPRAADRLQANAKKRKRSRR